MKVLSMRLKKFKRFDDLTIDLGSNPKKIIAMVGANGSGKSSIFDAFEHKLKAIHNMGAESADFYSKSYFYIDESQKEEFFSDNQVELNVDTSPLTFNSIYIRTAYRYSPKLDVTELKNVEDMLYANRPISSIAVDNRLTENYSRLMGNLYLEFENGVNTGNEVREKNIGQLNKILKEVLDIEISSSGSILNKKGSLYFKKENVIDFPYSNLSSGEKEVIDILLDLTIKVKEYNNTIFCIDEPELHLNTKIQRKLICEIEKLIPDNCQLWIATHSIGLLRALQDELKDKTQILDFNTENIFSGEKTLFPMEYNRNNWLKLFETSLDDLTYLVAPEIIVYCEGTPKEANTKKINGLDEVVYNKVFQQEFPNVLFLSSGGGKDVLNKSDLALKILNKAFIDVKILRVKDKDDNTMPERQTFISSSKNNRMLNRREIENYLLDKEILMKYCEANSLIFDDIKYNKIVTDIIELDLKPLKQQIMQCTNKSKISTNKNNVSIPLDDWLKDLAQYITLETNIYSELKNCIF